MASATDADSVRPCRWARTRRGRWGLAFRLATEASSTKWELDGTQKHDEDRHARKGPIGARADVLGQDARQPEVAVGPLTMAEMRRETSGWAGSSVQRRLANEVREP